jgi:proteasome lid subunit RPN8/RPN11
MVELPEDFVDRIVEQARNEAPNEACGLVAARGGAPERLIPMRNADESPVTYRLDPREQLQVFNQLEDEGLDLYAIYHSHTASEAYPSATDIRLALYPEASYVLVSLADQQPVLRAYRILDGDVTEEELVVR